MQRNMSAINTAVTMVLLACGCFAILHAQTSQRDQLLLAASAADSTLSIMKVDGKKLTLLGTVSVGKGAREEVCVSADGKRAYVSNDTDNSTTAVDLEARS